MESADDKALKVWMCDFYERSGEESLFREWTEKRGYAISPENPDILIHSCWGAEHLRIPARYKVSSTRENVYPNYNVDDYSISHMRGDMGGRNLFYPLAVCTINTKPELKQISESDARRKFGIFIAHQDVVGYGARMRKRFVQYVIDHYKHVDCPGNVLHNIDIPELQPRYGDWLKSKRSVVQAYKFLISFENSNSDGYMTEKLVDAFISNTVPIYWGSEGNLDPFPREAVICANDYPDFDSLLARIKEVDENDQLYLKMLSCNPLRNDDFWDKIREMRLSIFHFMDRVADRAMKGEDARGMNSPDRGMIVRDNVSYLMAQIQQEKGKETRKLSPLDKFISNLIPIATWRRNFRKKVLEKRKEVK